MIGTNVYSVIRQIEVNTGRGYFFEGNIIAVRTTIYRIGTTAILDRIVAASVPDGLVICAFDVFVFEDIYVIARRMRIDDAIAFLKNGYIECTECTRPAVSDPGFIFLGTEIFKAS